MISTPEDIVQESPDMASHPSTEPPVTEFAGQFFFRLWRATHTRTAELLGSVGLTPALFALLNVIGATGKRLCSRLALEVQRDGLADEFLQGRFVDLVPLTNIDRTPDLPIKAGVEQT